QFIHEGLDGEDIVVGPDATPEPRVDARRLLAIELHAEVRNLVRNVSRRIDAIRIDSLLKGWRQPTRKDGGARNLVLPAQDSALPQTRGEDAVIGRTIDIMTNVFFTTPYNLDRPIHLLRDSRRTVSHI